MGNLSRGLKGTIGTTRITGAFLSPRNAEHRTSGVADFSSVQRRMCTLGSDTPSCISWRAACSALPGWGTSKLSWNLGHAAKNHC